MATPFGIAYGIGAGLAGVPRAYMQGVGADQQLQARDMEMAKQQEAMQRAKLVDQEISAAVKEGGDIYGKLMSRFADKGLGQEAIKILGPYQKQKQMQNMLELEDAGRALGFGDSTPMLNYLNKRNISVKGIRLAQDGQTVDITTPDNRTVTMPTTDALAYLHEGKGMPNLLKLADQQEAARKRAALESDKFQYKKEVYDKELFESWRKRAIAARAGGSKSNAKLDIYRKFYEEFKSMGKSHEEADRLAWNRAAGDVTDRAKMTIEARPINKLIDKYTEELVTLDPERDVARIEFLNKRIAEAEGRLHEVIGRGNGAGAAAPKPTGKFIPDKK